jgi:2-amino-4-hydroxy-6-hydroxymethyldihydropteridine diphosphokinase
MNTAIIGLGSNIDPERNIASARKILAEEFHVLKESTFIRTKPIGYQEQDDFINGSVYLETGLPQEELKHKLKDLEKQLGREASKIKFGPRTIDLDIVIYNGKVVDRDFYEREFLKKAALELIPQLKY